MCSITRKLCKDEKCQICFDKSFKSINKCKYLVDKNINPRFISKFSSNKCIFNCINCDHNFETMISSISYGKWCPYCAIPSRILCKDENCIFCYNRSFASHEKSKYWSIKNNIISRYIFKNANDKYIFTCDICSHDFNMRPLNINSNNTWCPFCSKTLLCNNNDCILCYNNSFASHSMSKYWSKNNIKSSREVFIKSNNKYLLNCVKCNHEYITRIADINKNKNNNNCPFCGLKLLCDAKDCILCFNKSFASHEKSKYFSKKK